MICTRAIVYGTAHGERIMSVNCLRTPLNDFAANETAQGTLRHKQHFGALPGDLRYNDMRSRTYYSMSHFGVLHCRIACCS